MGPEDRRQMDASIRVTAAMCCFFGVYGVVLPYLAQWLELARGLDGAAIGAVLSISQIARIVTGPAIALWADRAPDRRAALRVLALGALAAHLLFFFWAKDFWALLITAFIALTMTQAATPFVEGAVLRVTQSGPVPYGIARGLGSISFIVANIAGGLLIARFGSGAVVAWVVVALTLYFVSVWFGLRPDPAPPRAHDEIPQKQQVAVLLRQKRFWILIAAAGLIQCSHAYYYSFSNLTWISQGLSPQLVGLLWAAGVAVEVGFLFALPVIERRITPEAMILLGGIGGAIRWALMGLAPVGIVLWPLQALHGCSFAATHVGAMRLIMRETPERVHGLAQTIYSGVATGVLMGLMTLLSGWLYDEVGARGYWVMAALAASGFVFALGLTGEKPWRRPAAPAFGVPEQR
jgi:PPP family 3-phenylpropionic acid transporter